MTSFLSRRFGPRIVFAAQAVCMAVAIYGATFLYTLT